MPRSSPFADIVDGPAPDAAVVELGRPTRAAFGCFAVTTLFLAVVAAAAFGFAVAGPRGAAPALRVVAVVLGAVFALIVAGLMVVAVKAVRAGQGIAVDRTGVWWRGGHTVVTLPWADVAVARMVAPTTVRGIRTSAPATPSLELCPVDERTLRRYPELTDKITSSEPIRPELPALRFTFRLPSAGDADLIGDAVARCAPEQWAAGRAGE